MSEPLLYFAYGSNLNLDGMAARCPDSEPVGVAILGDWALTFRGVVDIERRESARTHGALWRISDRDLERLDAYEGYPRLYRRELVPVRTAEGELVALTYVMNDDYLGLPSPAYYRTIKRGYEQWGLPLPALDMALAQVKDRLHDLGIRSFEPDGPKRLRPACRKTRSLPRVRKAGAPPT
ncbi:MAG: gamma-glutamylcyclotransferase family protein [Actinomycetota bacterium]